jgi:hypothetical protein
LAWKRGVSKVYLEEFGLLDAFEKVVLAAFLLDNGTGLMRLGPLVIAEGN